MVSVRRVEHDLRERRVERMRPCRARLDRDRRADAQADRGHAAQRHETIIERRCALDVARGSDTNRATENRESGRSN